MAVVISTQESSLGNGWICASRRRGAVLGGRGGGSWCEFLDSLGESGAGLVGGQGGEAYLGPGVAVGEDSGWVFVLSFSAEWELLAELDDVRCTCTGGVRPVHRCPPCAARLIERLRAEIVSLQVIAEAALTAANAQPDSRRDGGVREYFPRRVRQRWACLA
jgi:hypothetical protein